MTRPMQAMLLGVALGLACQTGFAANLEQVGQPDKTISVMDNYGVGVPIERGLRAVVPKGWKTYIQPDAKIPDSISWTLGQTWTGVLADLAVSSDVSVLVDWQEKAVYIRSPEGALEHDAKRAELLQAAVTPLPRFSGVALASKAQAEPQSLYAVSTEGASLAVANPDAVTLKKLDAASAQASQQPTTAPAQGQGEQPKTLPLAASQIVAKGDALGQLPADAQKLDAKNEVAPMAKQAKAMPVEVPGEIRTVSLGPAAGSDSVLTAQAGGAESLVGKGSGEAAKPVTDKAAASVATATQAEPVASATTQVTAPASVSQEVSREVATAITAAASANLAEGLGAVTQSADFRYTAPVALNKPSARTVAQGIANRYHLRLVWAAPEVQLKGPVTLLGNSADEDVMLLSKALGVYSPVKLSVPAGQGVLLVTARDGGQYADLASKPMPVASTRPTEVVGAGVAPATGVVAMPLGDEAPDVAGASREPAVVATSTGAADITAPAAMTLKVRAGEPLEVAIVRLATEQGYTVEWLVDGGFEATHDLEFRGSSLAEVLGQVLPSLDVSADIYKHEQHIIVRPADAALDR